MGQGTRTQDSQKSQINFVDPIYRDQVLWEIIRGIVETGKTISLAEMIERDPQKKPESIFIKEKVKKPHSLRG